MPVISSAFFSLRASTFLSKKNISFANKRTEAGAKVNYSRAKMKGAATVSMVEGRCLHLSRAAGIRRRRRMGVCRSNSIAEAGTEQHAT
jgi:hypothetical protein